MSQAMGVLTNTIYCRWDVLYVQNCSETSDACVELMHITRQLAQPGVLTSLRRLFAKVRVSE
jgi:hypothetical protein